MASPGQKSPTPSQNSGASHRSAACRQTNVFGRSWFAGQNALLPLQVSATSHAPAAVRQVVVFGLNESAGHCVLLPVQNSCTSQVLPGARSRHIVVAGAGRC
jgi:hypothetical protein